MNIYLHQRLTWLVLLISTCCISPVMGQDANLMKQLRQSSYLKYTMKADSTNAGITRWLKKREEKSRILPLAADFNFLRTQGPGTIKLNSAKTISGNGIILLQTRSSLPTKNPPTKSKRLPE